MINFLNRKLLITTALLILMSSITFAQTNPGGPPCDPSPGCTFNCCEPIPIDGGLVILLVAGLFFGAYVIKKRTI
jgi:hypothetical protein